MTVRTLPVWSVVVVPFPYVDRDAVKARPALAISTTEFQAATGLCWVLMITSALHDPWPGDLLIEDLASAGLAKASVVRTAKIATAEVMRLAVIGSLPVHQRALVRQAVAQGLG